jgi:transposase
LFDLWVEGILAPTLRPGDVVILCEDRYIDWVLYKERHLVECFFNRIKRFRRIALRCEKTVGSFKAFVDLACAMAWIG